MRKYVKKPESQYTCVGKIETNRLWVLPTSAELIYALNFHPYIQRNKDQFVITERYSLLSWEIRVKIHEITCSKEFHGEISFIDVYRQISSWELFFDYACTQFHTTFFQIFLQNRQGARQGQGARTRTDLQGARTAKSVQGLLEFKDQGLRTQHCVRLFPNR